MCYNMCVMRNRRVGVRELRQNLSVYLRGVKAGETLEVTERGTLVAKLSPARPADDPLAGLEAEGRIVRRSVLDLLELGAPLPARSGARPLSEVVDELRNDRA